MLTLRSLLPGPTTWHAIRWPYLLVAIVLGMGWFLHLSDWWTAFHGSVACHRPLQGGSFSLSHQGVNGGAWERFVLFRLGRRHVEVLLPPASLEVDALPDCPAGIMPERMPASPPTVDKERASLTVTVDGVRYRSFTAMDLALPIGLVGVAFTGLLGMGALRRRRTVLRRIEPV